MSPQYKKTLLTYLREKYLGTPIGIIAANGTEALRVALQLREDERWSGIAIVFSAVDEQRARSLMPLPNVTGKFVQFSLGSSIDALAQLFATLSKLPLLATHSTGNRSAVTFQANWLRRLSNWRSSISWAGPLKK